MKIEHAFLYKKPAKTWLEALPIGNGRLGAMVFGDPNQERIQLSEESIWAGPPVPETPTDVQEGLHQARQLIFNQQFTEAENVVQEKVLSQAFVPRSQQPLGDLGITFYGRRVRNSLFVAAAGPDPRQEFLNLHDYHRSLKLNTAVAESSWKYQGHDESAKVFCSAKDQVLVAHYSSSESESLTCRITLSREAGATTRSIGNDTLVLEGQASHRGNQLGVSFAGVLKVQVKGGECVTDYSSIEIKNAQEFTLILSAKTDYNVDDVEHPHEHDLVNLATKAVHSAFNKGYEQILHDHINHHAMLYSRSSLSLGDDQSDDSHYGSSSLDQLQTLMRKGKPTPALEALQFNYGRYLLISSSNSGSLPANLQGVWNHELAAPWNCDYHSNINLQMNYWLAEVCGLPECHESLFNFIEKLLPQAHHSANQLGCRGAYLGVSTDIWKYTCFYGEFSYGMWVMGLAWCSRHFMDHYFFSGDLRFLKERALPLLRECSLFFVDWLVEHPQSGHLVSGPSTSPENKFLTPEGNKASLSMGGSMDQQIIHECFTHALLAASILDDQSEWIDEVQVSLKKLALPKISQDGRLMEWSDDFPEVEPGHRHISHLYGLYPSNQYNLKETPDYARAATLSLNHRLKNGSGLSTWTGVWVSLLYSKLRNSEKAYEVLKVVTHQLAGDNLFIVDGVFQIDGNLGYTAAVSGMLIQSDMECIEVLPSLPGAWPQGRVCGLRAHGGFLFDLEWNDGVLVSLNVSSLKGGRSKIKYKGESIPLVLSQGESRKLTLKNGLFCISN